MKLLPKDLEYLEPIAQEMSQLPGEELNEDVDTSRLDAALRDRVKGLKLRDAVSRLTEDQAILKRWIKETKSKDGPALWIAAYLMRPGPLARSLLGPPPPPQPTVSFEPPIGWKTALVPRGLIVTKGKLFCCISAPDKFSFEHLEWTARNREELQRGPNNPWANLGVWSTQPVKWGECNGKKILYMQAGSTSWKSIEYFLEVPGGSVYVRAGHEAGKDFDEREIEENLPTLKIIPPQALA